MKKVIIILALIMSTEAADAQIGDMYAGIGVSVSTNGGPAINTTYVFDKLFLDYNMNLWSGDYKKDGPSGKIRTYNTPLTYINVLGYGSYKGVIWEGTIGGRRISDHKILYNITFGINFTFQSNIDYMKYTNYYGYRADYYAIVDKQMNMGIGLLIGYEIEDFLVLSKINTISGFTLGLTYKYVKTIL